MALQTSGLIDASDINNELGVATNSQFSLNSSTARLLAGITSGTIKFSDFYGKSSALTKIVAMSLPATTISGNFAPNNGLYVNYRGFSSHSLRANQNQEFPYGDHGNLYDRNNNSWLSSSLASTSSSPIMSFTKRVYSSASSYADDKADLIISGMYCYRLNYSNTYNFVLRVTYSDTAKLLGALPYTSPPGYNGDGPLILQTGFSSLKLYTGSNAISATATPFYTFSRSDTYNTSQQNGSEGSTIGTNGQSHLGPTSKNRGRVSVSSNGTVTSLTNPSTVIYRHYTREWNWSMGSDATVWNAFAPPSTTGGNNISFKFEE